MWLGSPQEKAQVHRMSTNRPISWLMRQRGEDLHVVAGPFPYEHDEPMEDGFRAVLRQDGVDTIWIDHYFLMIRQDLYSMDYEEFENAYLEWIASGVDGAESRYDPDPDAPEDPLACDIPLVHPNDR